MLNRSFTTSEEIVIDVARSNVSAPLVTRSVKGYVPVAVATPLMAPLAVPNRRGRSVRTDRPGGSDPPTMLQVYVPLPPVANNERPSICPMLNVTGGNGTYTW